MSASRAYYFHFCCLCSPDVGLLAALHAENENRNGRGAEESELLCLFYFLLAFGFSFGEKAKINQFHRQHWNRSINIVVATLYWKWRFTWLCFYGARPYFILNSESQVSLARIRLRRQWKIIYKIFTSSSVVCDHRGSDFVAWFSKRITRIWVTCEQKLQHLLQCSKIGWYYEIFSVYCNTLDEKRNCKCIDFLHISLLLPHWMVCL